MGCCGVTTAEAVEMLEGRIPAGMEADASDIVKVAKRISAIKPERVLEVSLGDETIATALTPFYRPDAVAMLGDATTYPYADFVDELRGSFADCLFLMGGNDKAEMWDAYTRYSTLVRRGGVIVVYDVRKKEIGDMWHTLTDDATIMAWIVGGFGVLEVR